MSYQKNVHNEEETKNTPIDPDVKRGGTKPTEKPNALHAEYMNIFRTQY